MIEEHKTKCILLVNCLHACVHKQIGEMPQMTQNVCDNIEWSRLFSYFMSYEDMVLKLKAS